MPIHLLMLAPPLSAGLHGTAGWRLIGVSPAMPVREGRSNAFFSLTTIFRPDPGSRASRTALALAIFMRNTRQCHQRERAVLGLFLGCEVLEHLVCIGSVVLWEDAKNQATMTVMLLSAERVDSQVSSTLDRDLGVPTG
ncbi:hypothetical protein EDB85DRAFT_1892818 [Lactarius pseudohatsudake]|nr:hypothetical protein EDB85DRAFT_1892818 [Lactarius pseudohatsudake]